MAETLKLENLSHIRFQILESMLNEFPDLKVQIQKEIRAKSLKQTTTHINDILHSIAQNSKNNYHETYQKTHPRRYHNSPEKESVPSWAKFAMASVKKGSKKYYVFK